ncbi:ABC transporter substrate-binding protein [Pseudonocardia sp.]|uniref:ABC transporter substrate-binding protein n=1 Tax=Pseudonocardia sp. TaxID=60912 RepID=UPI00260A2C24|nr:ABC transporter substrate-binding protein [Pseudonocardia sp.]
MRRLVTVATAALLLATLACGGPAADDTDPGQTGGEAAPLRILNSFVATGIDPAEPGAQWCWEFGYCEHPMRLGADGEPEPWVLEALDQVDELTWRLTLREGVTFQNGTAVDGAALAAGMQRQIDEFAALAAILPGATAQATGALEVTLRTAEPVAIVPQLLAERTLFPVYDAAAVLTAGEDLAGAGIFTAPYAVTGLDDERLTLAAHPGYWGGTPALPGVEVRFVSDGQARILALQNGEADIVLYPPGGVQDILAGQDAITLRRQPVAQEAMRLAPNVGEGLTGELAVRRAVALGVDYRAIAQDVMGGLYDVAEGMYPAELPYALTTQRTDPAEAARVLDAAGWVPGPDGVRARDGVPLSLVLLAYPQQPDTATVAVAIQAQLAPVGIGVEIRQVDDINAVISEPPQWDLALIFNTTYSFFSGDTVTPLRRYLYSTSEDNAGRCGVADPELDSIIDTLQGTVDAGERDRLLRRAQEIVMSEQHYLMIAGLKPFPVLVNRAYSGFEVPTDRRLITAETAPTG